MFLFTSQVQIEVEDNAAKIEKYHPNTTSTTTASTTATTTSKETTRYLNDGFRGSVMFLVKFIYSEKATKFLRILHLTFDYSTYSQKLSEDLAK